MDLKMRHIYGVAQAELYTGKFWCESIHNFRSHWQKCDMIRMNHNYYPHPQTDHLD